MAAAQRKYSKKKYGTEASAMKREELLLDFPPGNNEKCDPLLAYEFHQAENASVNAMMSTFCLLEIEDFEGFDPEYRIPRWIDLLKCSGCKTTTAWKWYVCGFGHMLCNQCRVDFGGYPEDLYGRRLVCPYSEPNLAGSGRNRCNSSELFPSNSRISKSLREALKRTARSCPLQGCSTYIRDGVGGPTFQKHLALCDFNENHGCPFSDCWEGGFTVAKLVLHLKEVHYQPLEKLKTKGKSVGPHKMSLTSSGESAVIILQLPQISESDLTRERITTIKPSLFVPDSVYDVEERRELLEEYDWAPILVQFEEIHFMLRIRKHQGSFWGWVERMECNENAGVEYVANLEIRQPGGQRIFTGEVIVLPGNRVPDVQFAAGQHRRAVMTWEKFVQYCTWNVLKKTVTTHFKVTIKRKD